MLNEQLTQIRDAIKKVDFDLVGVEEEMKALKAKRTILSRTEKQLEKSITALDELNND